MPINQNYILKNVGQDYMLIPLVGGSMDVSKVYNLTETAAFIYQQLCLNKGAEDIAEAMCHEYSVTYEQAIKDISIFIEKLKKMGIYVD